MNFFVLANLVFELIIVFKEIFTLNDSKEQLCTSLNQSLNIPPGHLTSFPAREGGNLINLVFPGAGI